MKRNEALQLSWFDRLLIGIAPKWGLERVRARGAAKMLARHYEAAQGSRRTSGWYRSSSDANAANGPALTALRELARNLHRNNGWAQGGIQTIVNNTVGWGIQPKPTGRSRKRSELAIELWNTWANSTTCDHDGLLNFAGIQLLVMQTIALSGEALVVRQPAASADGLAIPMRLQVLEPDYLDASRKGSTSSGGKICDGIEFDKRGQRVAYWLFTEHPGGRGLMRHESVRTPADRVLHLFRVDRPGQVRGVSWLASAIVRLSDLDDFEDAELMQQKVAACFGAFVTDPTGEKEPIAEGDEEDDQLERLEPGHIAYLDPGQTVEFAQPPRAQDGAFSERVLRRIAKGMGITYEDMTGDYSKVNYSSARMARLAHWQNVQTWRWQMLIPRLCDGVWRWAMELAAALKGWNEVPAAQWAAPPMPILEPDKEGTAYQRLVRIGAMTWPQMVRELGEDPVAQLREIAEHNKELDRLGIVLDTDPRKISSSGQGQSPPSSSAKESDSTTSSEDDGSVDVDLGDDDPAAPSADAPSTDPPTDSAPAPTPTKKQDAAEVKVFAYHQPFMRVKEIRESIGLSGDIEDSDLFANEFVAKHSGDTAADGASDPTA